MTGLDAKTTYKVQAEMEVQDLVTKEFKYFFSEEKTQKADGGG